MVDLLEQETGCAFPPGYNADIKGEFNFIEWDPASCLHPIAFRAYTWECQSSIDCRPLIATRLR